MTEEKAKSLMGRKVRGFKFEDGTDNVAYSNSMNNYIGKVGEIRYLDYLSCEVLFDDDYWFYPASLIEAHLVEESVDIKISDFKESEPIAESDLIQILPISEDSKKGLIKFQDLIHQIEQLKADKEEVLNDLKECLEYGNTGEDAVDIKKRIRYIIKKNGK